MFQVGFKYTERIVGKASQRLPWMPEGLFQGESGVGTGHCDKTQFAPQMAVLSHSSGTTCWVPTMCCGVYIDHLSPLTLPLERAWRHTPHTIIYFFGGKTFALSKIQNLQKDIPWNTVKGLPLTLPHSTQVFMPLPPVLCLSKNVCLYFLFHFFTALLPFVISS